jgi:hypothetical protein
MCCSVALYVDQVQITEQVALGLARRAAVVHGLAVKSTIAVQPPHTEGHSRVGLCSVQKWFSTRNGYSARGCLSVQSSFPYGNLLCTVNRNTVFALKLGMKIHMNTYKNWYSKSVSQ